MICKLLLRQVAATTQSKEDYKMPIFIPAALPAVAKIIGGAAARRIGMKGLQTLARRAKNQKDFKSLVKNKNKNLLAAEKTERAATAARKARQARSMARTDAMLSRKATKKAAGAAAGAGGVGAVISNIMSDDKKRREEKKKQREEFQKKRKEKAEFYQTRKGASKADPVQGLSGRKYTIKSGDSLSQVARDYGVSLAALKKANKIENVNKIRAGQKIAIPAKLSAKSTDVYKGTDTKKISMGRTDKQVQEQKAINKPRDKKFKEEQSKRTSSNNNLTNKRRGGKMTKGRGMGVALRGGGKVSRV
jgi:LysM repeat protein